MIFSATQQATETVKIAMGLVGKLIEKNGWTPSETGYAIAVVCGMLLCAVIPYLLGSINPAILISKVFYRQDIRNFGSGNAGTTNMLRTYGKGAALATFLIDLGKACVAVLLGRLIYGVDGSALAGFFVIIGHMFPLYYRFKGGKGVACLAMVVLTISPLTFVILLGIFVVIVAGTKFVSLGSVMCALLYPLILQASEIVSLRCSASTPKPGARKMQKAMYERLSVIRSAITLLITTMLSFALSITGFKSAAVKNAITKPTTVSRGVCTPRYILERGTKIQIAAQIILKVLFLFERPMDEKVPTAH
jgi:glycerol-3-phosphate acyltransferase PlsY